VGGFANGAGRGALPRPGARGGCGAGWAPGYSATMQAPGAEAIPEVRCRVLRSRRMLRAVRCARTRRARASGVMGEGFHTSNMRHARLALACRRSKPVPGGGAGATGVARRCGRLPSGGS